MFGKKALLPLGFSDGPVVKNLPASAGDTGLIPCLGTKIPCLRETKSVYHSY